MESERTDVPHRMLRDSFLFPASRWVLAVGMVGMLGLLIFVGRWLTFWHDEWDWILFRRDPSLESLLVPHVDHLSAVAVIVYQALLRVFGLASYFPYLAVSWTLHLSSVALLFIIARRRAGPLLSLGAAISLLFLGSAFEVLLHAFLMTFLLSTTFGLLAIERLTAPASGRSRYLVAGAALLLSVGSSSVGVLFTGLVLVWATLSRDWRGVMATAPTLAAYAAWYVTWGRSASGLAGTTTADVTLIPAKFLYGLGAAVSSVAGLPPERFAWVGLGIGLALVVAVAVGRRYGLRITALALAALLALLAEYGLQAAFRARFGIEHASRSAYLYPAAIFLWLAAVEIMAPLHVRVVRRPPITAALAVVLALAVIGNMTQFVGAARASRTFRLAEIAELRLIEAMAVSEAIDPTARPVADVPQIDAGPYLDAVSILGTPHLAIPEPTLENLGTVDPRRLDVALVRLLGNSFAEIDSEPMVTAPHDVVVERAIVDRSDGCPDVRAEGDGASVSWQPSGRGILVQGLGTAGLEIRVSAFAEPVPLTITGRLPDGSQTVALADLPMGLSWRVRVMMVDGQAARICDVVAPR